MFINCQNLQKQCQNSYFTAEFYDLFAVSPKKQSQFLMAEIDVKSYLGNSYASISGTGLRKNKPNQSQSLAP